MTRGASCLLLVLTLVSSLSDTASQCTKCPIAEDTVCNKCDCGLNPSGQFVINCKGQGLTQVPTFTSSAIDYYEITLADNQITSIPANKFSAVAPIEKLVITGNPITSIHNSAFQGLETSLQELLLGVNLMTAFPVAPLSVLGNLRTLSLTGFDLSSSGLPVGALQNLNQLLELVLSSNKLQGLPTGALSGQSSSLRKLTLNGNSIRAVPTAALNELQNLEDFSLVGNSGLNSLPANAFQGSGLWLLDLSQNAFLSNINGNAFSGLEGTLRTLALSSCQLRDSVLPTIQGLGALSDLDISQNGVLANIPDNFFSGMGSLVSLNLHKNGIQQLKKATLSGLGNLQTLDISDNSLSSVASDTFSSTPKLQELDIELNANLASVLQLNTFDPIASQLQVLNMEGTGFTNDKWPLISDLSQLTTLSLTNNQITQLPDLAFENLKKLETVSLDLNSLTAMSQRNLHGPNNNLQTINFNNNNIQTIAQCVFYEFTVFNFYQLGLTNNPLHCDCHMLWLLQKLKQHPNYDSEKYTINWRCSSPPANSNKLFARELSESDLICSPPETAAPCEDLSPTTTSPSTSSTGPGVSGPGSSETPVTFLLNISMITDTEMELLWFVTNTEGLLGFRVEYWIIPNGEKLTQQYDSMARRAVLQDLDPATDYIVCVMAQGVDWLGSTQCQSATTMPEAGALGPPKDNTLSIALGVTLGALVIIAIIVIVVVCKRKQKRKQTESPYQNGLSGLSASSAFGSTNSAFGVRVGGDSKRFTRLNREKIYQQNQDNVAFEQKLEGFSREERDRILGLVSHHGASTLSMISTASNPRYVREQTPLPAVPPATAGYLNPTEVRDDADKHLYSEIPGESNYQEIPLDKEIPFDSFI